MIRGGRFAAVAAVFSAGCQTVAPVRVPVPEKDPSAAWEAQLARVVTPDGYVDWDPLVADRSALDAYVAWLSRDGAVPSEPAAAHAWWLNAYNAWTMAGVLDAGVPSSVKDVPGWLPEPGSGFFLEVTWSAGGRPVSLYHAEHVEIRPVFADARDHAALNCASASCPPLRAELYAAAKLEDQLNDQARRWANDPVRGFRVEGNTVVMTPIVQWFEVDFPGGQTGSCAWWARHASPERRAELAALPACVPAYFEYDWRLNRPEVAGQVPPRAP
jgi:hypothetical protein